MKRGGIALARTLAVACCSARPPMAHAETRHYAIVLGNNQPPSGAGGSLSALQYADDDAADFVQLAHELGADTALLTVLDHESQQRFGLLARESRPPALAELRRAVARVRARNRGRRVAR